ncbi:magnesium chelatase subunit D [Altererythrobacter sediminis]|uniref:Magnesium chelatase subunit D n=2 Tax=Allopontixanthobacter sediminis TaxID=1689985 RepID=A0A845B544_9SPHN|nr:magnesium chelatase subunit D [Allopontixanthobacter sediminis]MXP45548.1 magnesium chelatase subunit D [Allopontixanthobacter sediminis]
MADSLLAAQLFTLHPMKFGGIVLRGYGPVRDRLLDLMTAQLAKQGPVLRMPINVDTEQLLGGLDLTETLSRGRAVLRPGLLARAAGGVVIVSMAERIAPDIAAHLAQAMDHREVAVILLDDGIEVDEAPPAVLRERAAFHCDLTAVRTLDFELDGQEAPWRPARAPSKHQRQALAATAAALGIHSMRPVLMAEQSARASAALAEAGMVRTEDFETAIRLVLAPRATRRPEVAEPAPPPPAEPDQPGEDSGQSEEQRQQDVSLDDLLIEAAAASIPQHILDGIDRGTLRSAGGRTGSSGQKEKSSKRGRPLGSKPGIPGDGRKLALIDTLRAAAPWQGARRAGSGSKQTLHIRKSDLRIRHYEQRRESLTIFAVDASGSSALSRLAEAKGAVELMLAQAHVKRSQVALIAFRQSGSEILLPPTRSLTRARRALGALPGGGGTPLAAGLLEALMMADASSKRGQTPTIAILTDGKANVTLAGDADRSTAMREVSEVSKRVAATGHQSIVIDISPRPREEAAQLASELGGRYLALPRAGSAAMVDAIESVGEGARA